MVEADVHWVRALVSFHGIPHPRGHESGLDVLGELPRPSATIDLTASLQGRPGREPVILIRSGGKAGVVRRRSFERPQTRNDAQGPQRPAGRRQGSGY
jgi:hypothetical protein